MFWLITLERVKAQIKKKNSVNHPTYPMKGSDKQNQKRKGTASKGVVRTKVVRLFWFGNHRSTIFLWELSFSPVIKSSYIQYFLPHWENLKMKLGPVISNVLYFYTSFFKSTAICDVWVAYCRPSWKHPLCVTYLFSNALERFKVSCALQVHDQTQRTDKMPGEGEQVCRVWNVSGYCRCFMMGWRYCQNL